MKKLHVKHEPRRWHTHTHIQTHTPEVTFWNVGEIRTTTYRNELTVACWRGGRKIPGRRRDELDKILINFCTPGSKAIDLGTEGYEGEQIVVEEGNK